MYVEIYVQYCEDIGTPDHPYIQLSVHSDKPVSKSVQKKALRQFLANHGLPEDRHMKRDNSNNVYCEVQKNMLPGYYPLHI